MTKRLRRYLRRIDLSRLLRLLVLLSLPPTWLEVFLLHYRGSFQNSSMWVPVVVLPVVLLGGAGSLLAGGDGKERAIFRPFAWLLAAVGSAGTFFHFVGVGRQMGGFRNWRYNLMTGPPVPAPPQIALFGLIGVVAADPGEVGKSRHRQRQRLIRRLFLLDAFALLFLAAEAGYEHYKGYFANPLMFVPVLLAPLLALLHLAALVWQRPTRALRKWLSLAAMLFSVVGFGFHLYHIFRRRAGGLNLQNLFYGPPVMAPLQLFAQGAIGLLAVLFDDAE